MIATYFTSVSDLKHSAVCGSLGLSFRLKPIYSFDKAMDMQDSALKSSLLFLPGLCYLLACLHGVMILGYFRHKVLLEKLLETSI